MPESRRDLHLRAVRLGRHPLHPALVHFPVACWTAAPAADLLQYFFGGELWRRCAFWSIAGGVALALPAVAAGLMDLLALPIEHPAQRCAQRHLLLMGAAWSVFILDLLARTARPGLPGAGLALSLIGFALMLFGAYAGGQLVYQYGVGQVHQEQDE